MIVQINDRALEKAILSSLLVIKTNQFRRVDFQWHAEANRKNSQTDRVLFDKLGGPSA